jgi:hypothetical protein
MIWVGDLIQPKLRSYDFYTFGFSRFSSFKTLAALKLWNKVDLLFRISYDENSPAIQLALGHLIIDS